MTIKRFDNNIYTHMSDLPFPKVYHSNYYHIYLATRQGFPLFRMITNLCNFAIMRDLPLLNDPKDLDLSYKTDLDFCDCFGRKKTCLINKEIQYVPTLKAIMVLINI